MTSAGAAPSDSIRFLSSQMKFTLSLLLASVMLAVTSTAPAAPRENPAGMRDTATRDQLSQRLRMAQQRDPIRDVGPPAGKEGIDPAAKAAPRDLVKESTILCYRGFLTLIPKQAVLHLPETLKSRFEEQPHVQVQVWSDFYRVNRGWIRTVEVTKEQAMGRAPLTEEVVKSFQQGSSAVIATYKGGPISIVPFQPEKADDLAATNSESTETNTKRP